MSTRRSSLALRLLLALALGLFTRQSRADQLSIHFETYGENEPSEVCIATAFAGIKLTPEPWTVGASDKDACGSATPTLEQATSALKCGAIKPKLFCQKNSGTGNRVVLAVSHALVTSFVLDHGTVTLQLNPDKEQSAPAGDAIGHAPAQLELMDGQYHGQSALPLRLSDGTEVVTIPLIPFCLRRDIEVPEVACENPEDKTTKAGGFTVLEAPPGRHVSMLLKNVETSGGSVTLERCSHVFVADWRGPVPPKRLEFETKKWTFRWHPNCLSPVNSCPKAVLPGASVSCDPPAPPEHGECLYTCYGAARFPVQVQLNFSDPNDTLTRVWNETLSTPGELLLGYVPQDQRRVSLAWDWQEALEREPAECKESKSTAEKERCLDEYDSRHGAKCAAPDPAVPFADWNLVRNRCLEKHNSRQRMLRAQSTAGDHIDHTELRTPEGSVHDIHYAATQIRIPELDCNDYVSYRYVGERSFDEKVVQVDANGQVELGDPRDARSDNWSLAGALGGGSRYTAGAGPLIYGPQAEGELILVWRKPRDWIEALDVELRAAAIIGTEPYCSRSKSDADGGACANGDWERIPYWRFPITIGLNWQLPMSMNTKTIPLTVGLAVGPAFTEYFFSEDGPKVRRPILSTLRGHIGFRMSHHVSLEAYSRVMFGEQPVETVFDDAGVARQGPIDGTGRVSVFSGAVGRLDDIF